MFILKRFKKPPTRLCFEKLIIEILKILYKKMNYPKILGAKI